MKNVQFFHAWSIDSIINYASYLGIFFSAPNVRMEMNPHLPGVGETAVHKDAIIFAGHKFIGGVQSPGVLIVKRSLLREEFEAEDMRDSHRYLHDPELREESGTAGVVGAIRCGLALQLKENVTPQAIAARQDKISRYGFYLDLLLFISFSFYLLYFFSILPIFRFFLYFFNFFSFLSIFQFFLYFFNIFLYFILFFEFFSYFFKYFSLFLQFFGFF